MLPILGLLKSRATLGIAAVVVSAVVGWHYGSSVKTAHYERMLHDQGVAYANAQNAAIEAANRAAEVERKRAVSAAEARVQRAAARQEITHAITADTNLDCEWRDDHRLRLESLYRASGYDPTGTPARMPHPLPQPAVNEPAEGAVGSGSMGVGRGLQSPAR